MAYGDSRPSWSTSGILLSADIVSDVLTAGQISAATITSQSLYSGQISMISGTATTWSQPCESHFMGQPRVDEVGNLVSACRACGELMTVEAPGIALWGRTLEELLLRVLSGDVDDEIRGRVREEAEALSLAVERMDILKMLLA